MKDGYTGARRFLLRHSTAQLFERLSLLSFFVGNFRGVQRSFIIDPGGGVRVPHIPGDNGDGGIKVLLLFWSCALLSHNASSFRTTIPHPARITTTIHFIKLGKGSAVFMLPVVRTLLLSSLFLSPSVRLSFL